jgi:hypothetical protein
MTKRNFVVAVADLRVGDYYADAAANCYRKIVRIGENEVGKMVLSFTKNPPVTLPKTVKSVKILDIMSMSKPHTIRV